jgi:hypothetical protein
MNNKRDDVSLSRLELVLLARYAGSKLPEEGELTTEVAALVQESKEQVAKARTALRNRGLLDAKAARKGKPAGRLALTLAGERALRSAFAVNDALTWAKVRDAYLPALGLSLKPGGAEATVAQKTLASLMIETLHVLHRLPRGATVNAVCDALITRALGLPVGAVPSLEWLRAQVLAHATGLGSVQGTPLELAKRIVAPKESAPLTKAALNRILTRRWLDDQTDHGVVAVVEPSQSAQATNAPLTQTQPSPHPSPPEPSTSPPPPEALLKAVRERLPLVSAAGRFGTEKVFISALWQELTQARLFNGALPIEAFKQWLLKANRDGELVLARADLVAAMDSRLVAESEVRNGGATFHFVLDRRAPAQPADRRPHAR